MATMLMLAGSALMAGGQIQQGRMAEKEGRLGYKLGLYNKALREREARAIEQKTSFESKRQAISAHKQMGKLRTQLAASGAMLDTGATQRVEDEQFAELELENMLIGYEGAKAATRARQRGEFDLFQGKLAKMRGRQAKKASYWQAGSSLLTGFGLAGAYGRTPKTGTPGATQLQSYINRYGWP